MSVADTLADIDASFVDLQGIYGVSVIWQKRTAPQYNTTTGAPTSTDIPQTLTAIVQDPTDEQLPSGQTRRHIRFVVRVADLTNGPIAIADYFTYGSFNYEVFAETIPSPGAVQLCDARLT